jgi:hypothetical protein
MALATSGPQAAAQIMDVRPILDCIEYTPGNTELTAWWGYDNRAHSTFIKPGADNFFDGPTPPRWTPQNRPVVDGAKPASRSAAPSTRVLPRSTVIEQASSRR